MSDRYLAAAVQFEPRQFDKPGNIAGLTRLIEDAAARGARLIVTPEMGTTGYCWFDREEVAPFVEPVPGPTTDHFAAIARARDCHIVIGMPEVDPATDLYYNSAVLIGPGGVVGVHRKTHPYISEPKWAAPGDRGHQVFATPLGPIALLICMDIHFIETARLAALGGAGVICHISNWLAERTPAPYWISRAYENGCYVIEANRWGLERTVQFSGGSCIIAPDATIEAVVDRGDGIALAEIDPGRVAAQRRAAEVPPRRPELYAELLTNTFAWNPRDFFGLYGHRPLPPGRRSRVAVAQYAPEGDARARGAQAEAWVARAVDEAGAALVVLPARALCGPDDAAPADGEAVARLAAIASRLGVHVVAGFAEAAEDGRHDAAVLAGPEGVVGHYRGLHLDAATRAWARPGTRFVAHDTPIGRIGLLLGGDALLPEPARVLALRGCDLIACPAAITVRTTMPHVGSAIAQNWPIPTGADAHHWHHLRCRGGENNVYFAYANAVDPAGGAGGKSGVFGPDTFAFPRHEAIVAEGEGIAAIDIDTTNLDTPYPTNVVRRKDLVLMRLPHHYPALIARN